MPIVQVELLEGRSIEQKRAMVREVTTAICQSLGVGPESVSVIIRDMPRHNFARGGQLASESGGSIKK